MTTLAPTLSTRFFPQAAAWLRDLVLIVLGSLLVAALAQVEIPLPFTPVPITGQTFAVLLVGAARPRCCCTLWKVRWACHFLPAAPMDQAS